MIWGSRRPKNIQIRRIQICNTEKPTMKMLFSRNWYLNVNFGDFSGASIDGSCRRTAGILCGGGRCGRGGHRLGDRRDAQHPYPRPQVGRPLPLLLFAAAGGAPPLQLSRPRVAVCVAATAPEGNVNACIHDPAVLRIRITLMRIRILPFTWMRIRILPFTLMRIRILPSLWCRSESGSKIPNIGSKPWKSAQIVSYSIHTGLSSAYWCGSGSSLSLWCGSGSYQSIVCRSMRIRIRINNTGIQDWSAQCGSWSTSIEYRTILFFECGSEFFTDIKNKT